MKKKKALSCGAVAVRYGEVPEILLIKQFAHKDTWGIPKGHVKDNESNHQCAIREVREETGLVVELRQQLPDARVALGDTEKVVVSYLASVVGDDVPDTSDPDCEVAAARWFPITELPQIVTYQRSLLEHVVSLVKLDDPDPR